MGKLLGLAHRKEQKGAMHVLETCEITTDTGVASDTRGKPGKRQVTVLSKEKWDAASHEAKTDIPWSSRRANVLVEGLSLDEKSVGKTLCIGSVRLLITGETQPCIRMDQIHEGLQDALTPDWRGGVNCQVQASGTVSLGDAVELQD